MKIIDSLCEGMKCIAKSMKEDWVVWMVCIAFLNLAVFTILQSIYGTPEPLDTWPIPNP